MKQIDEFGRLKLLLDNKEWINLVSETPILGTTEVWNLVNSTIDTHPIHLHLVQFQIVKRRPFNVLHYLNTGEINYTGSAVLPDPNERGWKDTVRANPGEVTSIIARFAPFPGRYVWHCHILEHEDHEMMRPYEVIKPKHEDHEMMHPDKVNKPKHKHHEMIRPDEVNKPKHEHFENK